MNVIIKSERNEEDFIISNAFAFARRRRRLSSSIVVLSRKIVWPVAQPPMITFEVIYYIDYN